MGLIETFIAISAAFVAVGLLMAIGSLLEDYFVGRGPRDG